MKSLFILVALFALVTFTTAQYSRTTYYTSSTTCSSATTPILDMYTPASGCTGGSGTNCTYFSSLTWYVSTACASSVPSTGPKGTLQMNVYSDTTCTSSTFTSSQILPLDTCVSVGAGSFKTSGCKTFSRYSDSACTTVMASTDISANKNACNSGIIFVCNSGVRVAMSVLFVMIIATLFSIVF